MRKSLALEKKKKGKEKYRSEVHIDGCFIRMNNLTIKNKFNALTPKTPL